MKTEQSWSERFLPASRQGGFQMEGYYVWCGSVVRGEDGQYHMFASRWPEASGFPEGYRVASEIVRATATRPDGPYTFAEVVLQGRGGGAWDSVMVHNPHIVYDPLRGTYNLFYIGSKSTRNNADRQIGCAVAASVAGPWHRPDSPLALVDDANNPAVCLRPDGSVLLAFRYGKTMSIGIAAADQCEGPYRIVNPETMPGVKLEDPYFFRYHGRYVMALSDIEGKVSGHVRYGALLVSEDGISDWQRHEGGFIHDLHVRWDDGTVLQADRRERVQLLFDEQGEITHLFTAVKAGDRTWNVVQRMNA